MSDPGQQPALRPDPVHSRVHPARLHPVGLPGNRLLAAGLQRTCQGGGMLIGDRIRLARQAAELSQRELATRLGVTHGLVGLWESHRRVPGRDLLRAIAEITFTSMEALMRGDDATPGVLVTDPIETAMLRRFRQLTLRQRQNLLELLAAAVDVTRGGEDDPKPPKPGNPGHKIHSLLSRKAPRILRVDFLLRCKLSGGKRSPLTR